MKNIFIFIPIILLPWFCSAFTLVTTNPDFLGWQDPEILFNVNTANCPASMDIPGLITDAVKIWNNVATSRVKISYNGSTTSTVTGNPTTVYCEPNFQGVTGADQNYVPAAALPTPSGNYVATGLLYLNVSGGSANISGFDRSLLLVIIAHEVGHILGLGHSQDPNALMYYNASAKTHLALAQDDIDGVSYLYPRNELGQDKMMGCGLVTTVGSPRPPSGGMFAVLLALMLLPLAIYGGLRKAA